MLISGNIVALPHQELREVYYAAEPTEPPLHSAQPPWEVRRIKPGELSTSTVKLCFIPWFR